MKTCSNLTIENTLLFDLFEFYIDLTLPLKPSRLTYDTANCKTSIIQL